MCSYFSSPELDCRCLRGSVDLGGGKTLPELRDVHVAANLIKIWLRCLPEPLVPFAHYQEALDAGAVNTTTAALQLVAKVTLCSVFFCVATQQVQSLGIFLAS